MTPALAQQVTENDGMRILWVSLLLIGLLIAAFVIVAQVRRRLRADDAPLAGNAGFTLSDLRQLHKSGQMSDREFELAKAKILEAAKRASERDRSDLRNRRQALAAGEVETKPAPDDEKL
jgi:hypothetical protein